MPVTVASYSFPHEAQLARSRLEAAGIPAFVADEHTINMYWLYSQALGGVKLQVPEVFVKQALEVLGEEAQLENETKPAAGCPNCGGNIEYLVRGKRVAYFLFWLLGFPLWMTHRSIRCTACGHEESLERKGE